jgi:hypothetical protein
MTITSTFMIFTIKTVLLNLFGTTFEKKKNVHLLWNLGTTFKGSIGWVRCQNNPIDVSFHLQIVLGSFDKNSAVKIQSKKDIGLKIVK